MKTMVIFAFFTIFCILLCIPLASSQEVEVDTLYSYKAGAKNGPENWGKIQRNWNTCTTGQSQSPIDISDANIKVDATLGGLLLLYRPAKGALKSRGRDIEVIWTEDGGGMQIFGDIYFTSQMHWHHPSEHTISGKRYPLELQIVHKTPDGSKLAVVGQLYDYGKPDPFLTDLEHHLKIMGNKKLKEKVVPLIDPYKLELASEQFFRYNGSLTVPPCTEGVIWNIFKKINTVSKEQLNLLQKSVHDWSENSRPLQKGNSRVVIATKVKKA